MKKLIVGMCVCIGVVGILGMASRPPVVGSPAPEIALKDLRGGTADQRRTPGHAENSYYADTDTHADN